MNTRKFTLAVLIAVAACGLLKANNTFFLPGDAYFFTRMDLADAKLLADAESPVFRYGSHYNGGVGCGYIGYQNLELTEMTDETKAAFIEAFNLVRTQIADDPNLGGKMSVFVYSKDYQWRTHGLALQFNEDWVAESVRFGAPRKHVRLESFVEMPSSIIKNWRDSNLVSSLNATCPKLPKGHRGAWTKSPVKIKSSKCRFLVIPHRDFDSVVQPANKQELIEISGGKLTQYIRSNGEWVAK